MVYIKEVIVNLPAITGNTIDDDKASRAYFPNTAVADGLSSYGHYYYIRSCSFMKYTSATDTTTYQVYQADYINDLGGSVELFKDIGHIAIGVESQWDGASGKNYATKITLNGEDNNYIYRANATSSSNYFTGGILPNYLGYPYNVSSYISKTTNQYWGILLSLSTTTSSSELYDGSGLFIIFRINAENLYNGVDNSLYGEHTQTVNFIPIGGSTTGKTSKTFNYYTRLPLPSTIPKSVAYSNAGDPANFATYSKHKSTGWTDGANFYPKDTNLIIPAGRIPLGGAYTLTGVWEEYKFNIKVNVGGSWKGVNACKVNTNGVWKEVSTCKINTNGSWKE